MERIKDSAARFSDRVENYIKYRPDYPKELITFLEEEIGLTPKYIVADIGAGTGKSSEPFLENGNLVFSVEPNTEMRTAAENLLRKFSLFKSINGTAENTTLETRSIDLIVAGQAFHWFNPEKTSIEFKRILKEDGLVLLIWNERNNSSPFLQAYDDFLLTYSTDYSEIDHRNVSKEILNSFFGNSDYKIKTLPNRQVFDFEGLKGRYLSCSYALSETHPSYLDSINQLFLLFQEFETAGKIIMEYETKVYYGSIS